MNIGDVGEGASEFVFQQGEMGAGEHDRIDRVNGIEHRLDGRAHGFDRNVFSGKLGFGQFHQFRRAVTNDRAVRSEFRRKVVDIGLSHRRFGAEYTDHA